MVKYFAGFLLLFSLAAESLATESLATQLNTTGYLKNYFNIQEKLDNDVFQLDTFYQSQNSARLMLDSFSNRLTWQIHYEPSVEFNSSTLVQIARESNDYRLTDIHNAMTTGSIFLPIPIAIKPCAFR